MKEHIFVKDLLKEDGKILNVQEINQRYDIRVKVLDHCGCIKFIRAYTRAQFILRNILKYLIF